MRVMVTGAAGRVGRAVVATLTAAGDEVVGFDLREPAERVAGVRYVTGGLEALGADSPALRDVDAVVHLAALMSWVDADADAMFSANVVGTYRLLEAVARKGLRRFVFASSGEVYPEMRPAYQPLDERHPRQPTSYYGMTKVLGEELVAFSARMHGLPAVTLRFSHVQDPAELLDPDSFFSGPRFFLRRRLERERLRGNTAVVRALEAHGGGGDKLIAAHRQDGKPVRMCILAAEDMARAIRLALRTPGIEGEVIGVGPDEPIDLAQLARLLGEGSGLPVVDVTFPNDVASYWTLNGRARELLGFRPSISYADMARAAVRAWRVRAAAGGELAGSNPSRNPPARSRRRRPAQDGQAAQRRVQGDRQ